MWVLHKYVLHSHKSAWLGACSSQAVGLPYVVTVLYFVILSQAHFFLERWHEEIHSLPNCPIAFTEDWLSLSEGRDQILLRKWINGPAQKRKSLAQGKDIPTPPLGNLLITYSVNKVEERKFWAVSEELKADALEYFSENGDRTGSANE